MAINYRPVNVYGNRVIAGMNYGGYGGQPVTINAGYVPAAPAYPLQNNLYYGPGVPVAQRWYGTDPNVNTVYAGYGVQQGGQQVRTLPPQQPVRTSPPQQPVRITQTAKQQVAQQPSSTTDLVNAPGYGVNAPFYYGPTRRLPSQPEDTTYALMNTPHQYYDRGIASYKDPLPQGYTGSYLELPYQRVIYSQPHPYENQEQYEMLPMNYTLPTNPVSPQTETEEEYNARMSRAATSRNMRQFSDDMMTGSENVYDMIPPNSTPSDFQGGEPYGGDKERQYQARMNRVASTQNMNQFADDMLPDTSNAVPSLDTTPSDSWIEEWSREFFRIHGRRPNIAEAIQEALRRGAPIQE